MKIIGHTEDGDLIIIMSPTELESARYEDDGEKARREWAGEFREGLRGLGLPEWVIRPLLWKTNLIHSSILEYDEKDFSTREAFRAFSRKPLAYADHVDLDAGLLMSFNEWVEAVKSGQWTHKRVSNFGPSRFVPLKAALDAVD